jgi:peptidoglycan-associated lipoprotein
VQKPADKVETRGVAAPGAEVKALDGSQPGAKGADAKANGNGQPSASLMDPRNPASPLAQRRILFDYDSAAIRDEYRPLLEAHAQYMKKEKAAKAILQGHADERGSREYNLALGQRRAESVYKALSLLGVAEAQIEAVSLGEEKPVAEGHDEEAWKQNRRTEILYQGE